MKALLRNPLYGFVFRLWWVPVLVGTALAAVGGPALGQLALLLAGLGAGFLAAATAAAWLHGYRERRRTREEAADERQRFLCPECLRFGELAYACGACEREVEAFVLETGGGYVNDCAHCGAALLPQEREGAVGLLARCRHCRVALPRDPHHERRVCVLGVPGPLDLSRFPHADSPERAVTVDGGVLRLDDRSWLTYVLDLCRLAERMTARAHAAHHLDALWLDGRNANALELGEQLDGFLRRARLSLAERKRLRVCLGCSRDALPRDVYNVLEGRFPNPDRLEYGVTPEALIERLTTLRDLEEEREPARVLAVIDPTDWNALRRLQGPYGAPLLSAGGRFRPQAGPAARVRFLETLHVDAQGHAAGLAGLEAVWISGSGDPTATLERLERLVQAAGLTRRQQQEVAVLLAEPHPEAPLRDALQARFRKVRAGVAAEEFLRYGKAAGTHTLLDWPTHVIASCLPGDFEALYREMGPLQRERLGSAWAVEETGNRTTFLADLSAAPALPGNFGDTPSLGEIQALWLGECLPAPLELAEQLDRLFRSAWRSEERRSELTACVWHASPEPALRNVLEARFGTVRYGVSAREFLEHGARCADRARIASENIPAHEPLPLRSGRST